MKRDRIPVVIILIGLGLMYPVRKWVDAATYRPAVSEESLYFASGKTIKKMSLGLESLVADVYWIRTLQYFGRKLLDQKAHLTNPRDLRVDLLAPLLRIVVDLDPHNIPAYRFGAIFLPDQDPYQAIDLLDRGIRDNPRQWRLYQDLGFIYWHMGNYDKAAEVYQAGSEIEGAMWWMQDIAGVMKIKGGERNVARSIYSTYLKDDDDLVRHQAEQRIKELDALDELDAINAVILQFKAQRGSCPQDLRQLAPRLRALGLRLNGDLLPTDPDGYPYTLNRERCAAETALESTIPRP